MKTNMGNADRIIRAIVALAAVTLYATGLVTGVMGVILLVLAVVFFGTSLWGFCPLYAPLHISTCKPTQQDA